MNSRFIIEVNAKEFELRTEFPSISLGENGCVVGHLFSRQALDQRVGSFKPHEISQITASSGRSLLTDCWGGYVAVVRSDDGTVTIIRDPSGIMPCYWRERKGRFLFSNDIEDIACWGGPASVDFAGLGKYLSSPGYNGSETGLADTHELPAGHALVLRDGSAAVAALWSPWQFALLPAARTFTEAAHELKATLRSCVGAWASCFDNIALGVSGGLDSSIVASVAVPHTQLRCLNMYADDADGDERHYAGILTDYLGLELETGHFDVREIDVGDPVLPNRPWPNISYFASGIETKHRQMALARPINAYFSGNGGDNIFCSVRSASPFLDRLAVEGPGSGLKNTLRDLCTLTGSDGATVLKTAWQQYLKFRKGPVAKMDMSGLLQDNIGTEPLQHPWKFAPKNALAGKIGHVGFLADAQQSHELYARGANVPHIAPLMSQPIVELCLSIPAWLWIEGGRDRAVAREAFRHELPEQLIRRSSKGGPGMFVQNLYRANEKRIKSIIFDGVLVRESIVDRHYIDAKDDLSWRGNSRVQRLLQFASVENWCRYWDGRTGPAVGIGSDGR